MRAAGERGGRSDAELRYRTLARVLSRLVHHARVRLGYAGSHRVAGARSSRATRLASDAVGRTIDPLLQTRAQSEKATACCRAQDRPVVINTKGASASGKSTLRPLQKKLAGDIGVELERFRADQPGHLAQAAARLRARSAQRTSTPAPSPRRSCRSSIASSTATWRASMRQGNMSHLLIDRFRFDSFAPDSDEEGSNLLTRFGQTVYLFFMITPPEQLVERAWKRGLEFGRYKAVDDTLAHAVEAYTGIPNVFFTWVRRSDKRIRFEFLDNTVALGERPRTVAFGDNDTVNVLDVNRHARHRSLRTGVRRCRDARACSTADRELAARPSTTSDS